MMSDLYVYRAMLVNVVDGDTFDMMIDPGFYLTYAARVRLYGYDTPELRRGSEFEKEKGIEASKVAFQWLDDTGDDLLLRTHKADSFGRWLAEPFFVGFGGREEYLGAHLRSLGLASTYPTRWRDEFDAESS